MAKRAAEQIDITMPAAPTGSCLVVSVITIMKAAYGTVPKAFWGLSQAGEACIAGGTSREFTIDTPESFNHYCRHLTHPGAYRIVRLRTAGAFNRRITILDTIRNVVFGVRFDSEVLFSSSLNLEEIEFEEESVFNRPIVIPAGVVKVTVGSWFNRSATFPSSLRILKLGEKFNCHVDLPQGLLELYPGDRFNQTCVLPDGIQVLRLGADFRKSIHFPPSLREIDFSYPYFLPVMLPHGLERVTLRGSPWPSDPTSAFPDTLKYANIGRDVHINPGNLPLGLEELVWHRNAAVSFPVTLKHLTLGVIFHMPLELHEGLESIVFLGDYYSHPLDLPSSLQSITLKKSKTPFTLPEGCVRLYGS